MTLDEALNAPAQHWEAMTDAQILEFFKPYLVITRPELAEKPTKTSSVRNINSTMGSHKRSKANAILAQLGMDFRV